MKMFANENLFDPIIDHLRSIGHDVLSLREAGLWKYLMMKYIS